ERRRLAALTDDDGAKAKAYLSDKDALDVLEDFPHTHLDAQRLIASLGKLAPRLYSISSSPKAHPGEVHLTIGIVRYGVNGRLRKGVTSTFLAERLPLDRKSTRLNSSHVKISYAVFCLKKKTR